MSVAAVMDYRTPRQGERLTWDGRRFILTAVGIPGAPGWWQAIAADGRTTLQGNLTLRRCGLTNGWAPV